MRHDLRLDEDAVAVIRATDAESLVIVMLPGRDPVTEAQIRAAIGPLAIEIAPRRINLVAVTDGADKDAIDALVAYLDAAESTTGQIVDVS
ncbi:MAG: hypothetical protein OSB00_12295 [Sphingomonas bacterium]|nr:hypothetical protein [Sphingomonas bacterium]